jgi:hypothetical protein
MNQRSAWFVLPQTALLASKDAISVWARSCQRAS